MIVTLIGVPRSMTDINRSELALQPLTASVFKPLHFFFVISGVALFVAARRGRSHSRPFQFTHTKHSKHCNVQTPLFLPQSMRLTVHILPAGVLWHRASLQPVRTPASGVLSFGPVASLTTPFRVVLCSSPVNSLSAF